MQIYVDDIDGCWLAHKQGSKIGNPEYQTFTYVYKVQLKD